MKGTPSVLNARAIAQDIAGLLWQEHKTGVREIFLFGSTLTSPTPHDIDLGIVYTPTSQPLRKAEYFSGYGKELGPGRSISDRTAATNIILKAFVPELQDDYIADELVLRGVDPLTNLTGSLCVRKGVLVRAGVYTGANKNPTYFPVDILALNEFYGEVEEQVRKKLLPGQIEILLADHGLGLSVLDMQLLNENAMRAEGKDERHALINPCEKDYTFWSSVLDTAQCYNPSTHAFDRPIELVYPNAVTFFRDSEKTFLRGSTGTLREKLEAMIWADLTEE